MGYMMKARSSFPGYSSRITFILRPGPAGLALARIGESCPYADFPLPSTGYATPWPAKAEDRDAHSARLPALGAWSAIGMVRAHLQLGLRRESAGMT